MRYLLIFLSIFFLNVISTSLYAQKNVFTSSNVKGASTKVDSLPFFIYEKPELDTFLMNNQFMRQAEEEWGVNIYVYASFMVDSIGKPLHITIYNVDVKINDLTELADVNYMDTMKLFYSKESARLINLTDGMWVSSSSNRKNKLNIIIPFKTEAFERKTKESLKESNVEYSDSGYRNKYSRQGEAATTQKIFKYYDFGAAKLMQGKLLIAKRYFEQALKVKKDDLDALYNLGVCYVKLKDYEKACSSWKTGQAYGDTGVQGLIDKYCK